MVANDTGQGAARIRVLVVGELAVDRSGARAILRDAGFDVRVVAPEAIGGALDGADLILVEDTVAAADLAPTLGAGLGGPALLAICEQTAVDERIRWLDAGASDCVTTPLVAAELVARVRAHASVAHAGRLEKSLELGDARLEALLALSRKKSATQPDLMEYAIEEATRLTGSTIGYLHFYDESEQMILLTTWTRGVLDACSAPTSGHYPLASAGVWADCVRLREPVIHNDYQHLSDRRGYPDGHTHLVRHLSVPVFDGSRIVAIAGVGNKPEPYDQSDARQLSLFMASMWEILERNRAEEKLLRATTQLEDKVRERTSELQTANALLSDTFEAITHPLYVVDVGDMRIRMSNSAAAQQGVVVGVLCYEATHGRAEPCDGTDHPCPIAAVTRTGKPVVVEHVHCDPSGAHRYFEIHGYPLLDREGVVRQMIEYALDVTDRVTAEREVRRRAEELRLINSFIGATVSEATPEAVLDVACRELGLAFELPHVDAGLFDGPRGSLRLVAAFDRRGEETAALGRTFPSSAAFRRLLLAASDPVEVPDAQNDGRLGAYADHFRQAGTASVLFVPLTAEGDLVGVIALHDNEAKPFRREVVSLAKTVGDQAAMAVAHARLSRARRLLEAAIEQTADSVVITDAGRQVVYVNPAFERVSGYSRAEVVGTNDATFGTCQQDDENLALWDELATGRVWRGRVAGRTKSGEAVTEDAIIAPIRDETGRISHHIAVKRDVTRELRLEEHVRQSQKLESIGRLAGGVAHDFNNLLGVILGYSGLALKSLPTQHPAGEFVEEIEGTAQRGAVLTRQLLTFARQHVTEPRSLDLWDVIENLQKMLRRIIGEDIELDTGREGPVWYVRVDPGQMEQVIVNLAVNARDAMPEGGRLDIVVRDVQVHGDEPRFPEGVKPGEYVELAIADSGVGMTDEVKEHMFEPFFSTKDRTGGTGLGLATSFGIVTQSGGRIWAESTVGHGTTMRVLLPRCEPPSERRDHGAGTAALARGTETVLLVEDDDNLRRLAHRVLRACGYSVLEASEGARALELAAEHAGEIHLVLTDVVMRGMSGPDLARELRRSRPRIRVMFMSGYPGEANQGRDASFPDSVLLAKPFSVAELARKVRDSLDGTAHS